MAGELTGLRTSVIDDPADLDAARHLLYRVYCAEMDWFPRTDNPSRQAVRSLASGQLGLVDIYDDRARWIGLFEGEWLVGCLRLVGRRDADPRLEVERYFTLPPDLGEGTTLLECNRLALDPRIRGRGGAVRLHLEILRMIAETGDSLIIVAVPATGRLATKLMGMSETGLSFRYHRDDPEPAQVYLLLNRGDAVARRTRALEAMLR